MGNFVCHTEKLGVVGASLSEHLLFWTDTVPFRKHHMALLTRMCSISLKLKEIFFFFFFFRCGDLVGEELAPQWGGRFLQIWITAGEGLKTDKGGVVGLEGLKGLKA